MPSPATQILIVEDDPGLAQLFGDKLRHDGHTCAAVDSARACLAWLETNPVDLMLLDYSLPDRLAPALVEELRTAGRLPPFIVVTGHGDERVAVEMMKLGARDYLVKDNLLFDRMPAVVLRTLREVNNERQLAATSAALRESEAFRKRIFESSQIPIVVMDAQTFRYIDCNPAAVAIYRCASHSDVLGRTPVDFSAPVQYDGTPSPEKARHFIQQALAQGQVVFEWHHQRPDGELWDAEVHLMGFTSDNRRFLQFTLQDITERRRSVAALLESEEKFASAFRNSPISTTIRDLETSRYLEVNERCLALTGHTRDEIVGHTAAELGWVAEADRAENLRLLQAEGLVADRELRVRRKDGTTAICSYNAHVIPISGRACVFSTMVDITERKRAEDALQRSESLFRRNFDDAPVGSAIVQLDRTFLRVNAALCRFLGYAAEELRGKPITEVTHPDDVVDSVAQIRRLLGGEVASFEIEKRYLRKDGATVWGRVSVSLVRDADGRPLHLAPIIQDITEQKRAETELRQTRAILQVAMDQSPAGIAIADAPSGALRYVNDAGLLIRGGDRATIVNGVGVEQYVASWKLLDLDGRPLRTDEVPLARAVMFGENCSREFIIHRGDDDDRVVLANAAPIKDESGTVVAAVVVFLDITEQKWAERDLEQFFALVPDLVCIASVDGFFRKLNDEWTRVLGYSKAELMAVPYTEFVHPEDRKATHHEIAQQAAGNSTTSFVNRYRAKDGTYHWFEWNATATTSNGVLFAAARDITQHRQAEEAMRESELRYRTLANSGPGLVWTSGLDKKCDYFNQTWLDFTGRRLEQELGDGWAEGVHPEDLTRCVTTYVTAFDRRERFSMDYRLRHHSGAYRWIQDDGTPRHDSQGDFLGYIGHCLDITERKLAAEALHESERRFQTIFENSPAGVALVGLDGRYQMVNPAFSSIFGYTAEELQQIDFFKITHPDDQELSRRMIRETMEGKGRRVQFAKRYFHKDGRLLWTEVTTELVSAADGSPRHFVTHLVDITERKRAEEALRESEEKFAKVFHDAPVWIAITDLETAQYLDVNEAVLRASGFTREEVIGHTAAGIGWITPADRTRLVQALRDQGRITDLDMDFRTKEGRSLQGLVNGEQIALGGRPCLLTVTIDITERRRAEELIAWEAALVENSADICCVKDLDLRVRAVNSAFLRLAGAASAAAVIGKTDAEIFRTPGNASSVAGYMADERHAQTLHAGQSLLREEGVVLPDGTERLLLTRKFPVFDPAGRLIATASTSTDVTERKRAEDDRNRSHELLAKLTAQVPGVVYQYRLFPDGSSCFPFSSPGMRTIYEYAPEDLHTDATPVFGRLHPEDAGAVAAAILESARTLAPFHCEFRVVLPHQGLRWRLSDAMPERTADGGTLWHGIISDITERKLAEEALANTRTTLEAAFEQTPIPMVLVSMPDGVFRIVNSACRELLGITDEPTPVGRHLTDFQPTYQDFDAKGRLIPLSEAPLALALQGQKTTDLERKIVTKDGAIRWAMASGSPVYSTQGTLIAAYLTFPDITARKLAEEALRESLREKEALLKEVHHRVKNNLQVISSLLRLESGRVADPGTRSVLGDMQNRIRTMALLHESLYRSGNLAEVDMKAYLETLCQQLFRAASARSSGPVELQVAVAPMRLELNRTVPCGLIVNELVSNCLKHAFADGRGGRVHVALQPTPVTGEWGLRVADNGVGLPAGFTLENLPSLGLQLVSDLARQLQGRLEIGFGPEAGAPAAPGPGAAFTVYFKVPLPEPRPVS